VNTYAWIQATAHSKVISANNPIINPASTKPLKFGPWLPNKTNNKCPATMFAANRTANVPGRIIELTVSIITMTGINGAGVPRGTRWAILWLNCLTRLKIILPNHKGRAKDRVKLKCLEEVNT